MTPSRLTITPYHPRRAITGPRDWYDLDWDLVHGCAKASPGCQHCTAAWFFAEQAKYGGGDPTVAGFDAAGSPEWLTTKLLPQNIPHVVPRATVGQRIAVCMLGDLFQPRVPDDFLDRVWQLMINDASRNTFGLLTKRPTRLRHWLAERPVPPHIWLGVSVEDNAAIWRIPILMSIPARVRWVSAEPLLEAIDFSPYLAPHEINWIVAGPPVGLDPRPFDPAWIVKIRDDCKTSGVPFFTKHLINDQTFRDYPVVA